MATLAPSFLIGSSSLMQETKKCIFVLFIYFFLGGGGVNFGQVRLLTTALTTLERLIYQILMLWPL